MQKNRPAIIIISLFAIVVIETSFLIVSEVLRRKPQAVAQDLSKGLDNVFVQVRVKKETSNGQFTDSIYYTADEWSKTTAEAVQKAEQARVDNWMKVTKTPEGR